MVVDDHPMWRRTLKQVLEEDGRARVVAEAADGEEALRLAGRAKPQVVVMDINLPGLDGTEATRRLLKSLPGTKVLALSASEERTDVVEAVRAGASGYLPKTTEPTELVDAVRRVHEGEMVFPPALADAVLRELRGEEPTDEPLRVVLADGSALFREGLGRVLDEEGFDVLGRAGDLADLLRLIEVTKPQVVLTEIHLPPGDGPSDLDEVRAIRDRGPGTAILVLSQEVDPEAASSLLHSGEGGVGYLLKDRVSDVEHLAEAIRRVANRESVLDPEVAGRLVGPRTERDPLDELTPREKEVLALMAEGRSNQAISERLFFSPKAAEAHVRNIFMKLGLEPAPDDHRRVLAVITYLQTV
jgi:DNA-binding NarL/FixJ family response regulator